MEAFLLKIYGLTSALVMTALCLFAAGGFVQLWRSARRGAIILAPSVALTVAGALLLLAGFYGLVFPFSNLTVEARGGLLRIFVTALLISLIAFNIGVFRANRVE